MLDFLVGYRIGRRRRHPSRRFTVGHAIALLVLVAYVVTWWYIALPTLAVVALAAFLVEHHRSRSPA